MFFKIILSFGLVLGLMAAFPDRVKALSQEESARVEAFLTSLSAQKDLVFIRNGREYKVDRAVSHLRRKLRGSEDSLTSAEEFIDRVAWGSSISGEPYYIRRPGGQNEPAKPFFTELLKKTGQGQ
ncbi:MAG: DUF5329 family protein [Deltaproteobacteria bacterium]|nr:DUF5329 family protein [Deltaproteobacteria bacterium]